MNLKNALPVTFALLTFAACTTTATVGHYAEWWPASYFVGLAYAMSQVDVADYRLRLSSLQHDVMSVTTFGQVTATDFEEGTTELETRSVR